jgi:hypothetical protein
MRFQSRPGVHQADSGNQPGDEARQGSGPSAHERQVGHEAPRPWVIPESWQQDGHRISRLVETNTPPERQVVESAAMPRLAGGGIGLTTCLGPL